MFDYVDTIIMTVDEWIAVPDNPIQRDTERHAAKAKKAHLKAYAPSHRVVTMAVLPDGSPRKIDGHTRADFWGKGEILPPTGTVVVNVYAAETIEDVMEAYTHHDNRGTVDDVQDTLTSAYKACGLHIMSDLFKRGSITSTMDGLNAICRGSYHSGGESLAEVVGAWAPEIELCDRKHFRRDNFPAALLGAMIITVRLYGEEALDFWVAYDGNAGIKGANGYDGVCALVEAKKDCGSSSKTGKYMVSKGKKSTYNIKNFGLLEIAISCFETWRRGDWYSLRGARRTDIVKYLSDYFNK